VDAKNKRLDDRSRHDRLYALAREWGDIATEELELAKSLHSRAAEQEELARQLDRQGRIAEAAEARRTVTRWLELADELLAKAEAALLREGTLEQREDLTTIPAVTRLKHYMPDLLTACWHLAQAVQASATLDAPLQRAALDLYEGLLPDLASFRRRSTPVLMERLKRFLEMTRDLPSDRVLAIWDRYRHTLDVFAK